MGTEIVVGMIGLGGAVVGALAAFLGVVYQQRHQAKLADQQRRVALSEAAIVTLIAELEALREHAWKRPDGEAEDGWREWIDGMGRILGRIRLATLRLPNQDLRETLEAAWLFEFGHSELFQGVVGLRSGRMLMMAMTGEAQQCLGHYLRQEPIPRTDFLSRARRERQAILDAGPQSSRSNP